MVTAVEERKSKFSHAPKSATMEFKTADIEDYSLNTIPNLVTSLLSELKKTYVVGSTHRDKKMRDRIERVIQIVSTDSRLGGMIVQANAQIRQKRMRSI